MSDLSYEGYLATKINVRCFEEHIIMSTQTIMNLLDKIEAEREQITAFREAIVRSKQLISAYEKAEGIEERED